MNIRSNNPYVRNFSNRVAFGDDQGVLNTVEKLQKRVTVDKLQELQAHLGYNMSFSPEFVKKISSYTDEWKQTLVVHSKGDVKQRLKDIFRMK